MALQRALFMMDGFGIGPRTFTRPGAVGKFTDIDGILKDAAADELRREWLYLDTFDLANLPDTPSVILEDARTNLIDSDDFDSASWSKTNTPVVTSGVSDPAGGTSAFTIEDDDGALEEFIRNPTAFTAGTRTVVFVVRENTMPASGDQVLDLRDVTAGVTRGSLEIGSWTSGEPSVTASVGTFLGKRYMGNGYWALYLQAPSVVVNTNEVRIRPASTAAQTGSIDVYRVNAYDTPAPSYSILDASETRNVDTLFFQFPPIPQELTVYVKFIEAGTILAAAGDIILEIGSAADGDPRLVLAESGGFYKLTHDPGVGGSGATLAAAPSWGDTVELRGVLNSDGSVVVGQSINSAAETTASDTTTAPLGSAWADTRLYLNSVGASSHGLAAFISVKIVAGVKTMAEMRSLEPFFAIGGLSVPVLTGSPLEDRLEIGDRGRTFDGTLRETIRSRVSTWDAETVPLTVADANEIQEALEQSTQPQQAFGSMIKDSTGGLPDVFTRMTERTPVQSSTERRYALSFTAEASS